MKPNSTIRGSNAAIQIFGSGFPKDGISLRLIGRTSSVVIDKIKWISKDTLEVQLPIDTPTGEYDLEVKVGEQKPVLLGGAFEILSNSLQIYFINVGQGDATFLRSPSGKTMLIDAGPPGSAPRIAAVCQKLGIQAIDYVLLTHFDADHVGGLEAFLNGPDGKFGTNDDIQIKEAIWDPGGKSKNYSYSRAREHYKSLYRPLDGRSKASFPTIDLGGGVKVEIRTANGVVLKRDGTTQALPCGTDSNCRSLGSLITVGKFRMWTAGDLTGGGNGTPDVETILAKNINPVGIYRAHHHGSKTSSNAALLKALNPQLIVISSGKDSRYCHPYGATLESMLGISGVWILLTTEGISSAESVKRCQKSTKDRLKSIGSRAVLGLGTFVVSADLSGFSLESAKLKKPMRWKSR